MTTHQPRRIRPHATPKPPKPAKQEPHGNVLAVRATTLAYDYAAIPEQHREQVQRAALDIRARLKRTVEDMIEIGRQLNEVQGLLPSRLFYDWAQEEFGMSRGSVFEFAQIAMRFGEMRSNFERILPSIVRRLAQPSVPDEAVAAVIAEAEAQAKPLRYKDAMAIVRPFMAAKAPKPKQLAGPVADPEPDDAIDAEYTVIPKHEFIFPAHAKRADEVQPVISRALAKKLQDGLVHRLFRLYFTADESDELLIALTRALEGHPGGTR